MKRIKKKNITIFLLLNIFIASIISFLVVSIANERIITKLSFERNVANKYTDFLDNIGVSTSYTKPDVFIRRLDNKLRNDPNVFGLENQCLNIKKIKGTLPISFVSKEDFFDIEVISNSRDEVAECANHIHNQIKLYNERVKERYRENYIYFSTLENKEEEDKILKKINLTVDKIFTLFDKMLSDEMTESANDNVLSNDFNLKVINTYLGLNNYMEGKQERVKLQKFSNKITKENFFSVVEKLTPIVFKGQSTYVQSTPKFYKIFIATYIIFLFLYVLSIVAINNIFKKIF